MLNRPQETSNSLHSGNQLIVVSNNNPSSNDDVANFSESKESPKVQVVALDTPGSRESSSQSELRVTQNEVN